MSAPRALSPRPAATNTRTQSPIALALSNAARTMPAKARTASLAVAIPIATDRICGGAASDFCKPLDNPPIKIVGRKRFKHWSDDTSAVPNSRGDITRAFCAPTTVQLLRMINLEKRGYRGSRSYEQRGRSNCTGSVASGHRTYVAQRMHTVSRNAKHILQIQ